VEFDIMYGEGISKTGELLDLGIKAGIVEKSGSWFSYNSERIGQGRENAKAYLKQNPQVAAQIEAMIRQNAGLISNGLMAGADEAAATASDADADTAADTGVAAKGKPGKAAVD
ncbi:MAG: intein-containing recombinase RecA, partial [Rhodospirillales bacterium]